MMAWHSTEDGKRAYLSMILKNIASDFNKQKCECLKDIPDFDFQFNKLIAEYNLLDLKDNLYLMAGRYYEHILFFINKFEKIHQLEKLFKDYSDEFYTLKNFLDNNTISKIKLTPTKQGKAIDLQNKELINLIDQLIRLLPLHFKNPDKYDRKILPKNEISAIRACAGLFSVLFDYLTFYSNMGDKRYDFIVKYANLLTFDILQNTDLSAQYYLSDLFKTAHRPSMCL